MLKCQSCGDEMVYQYRHERGRHYKEIYLCKSCRSIKGVNVGIIPNVVRRQAR